MVYKLLQVPRIRLLLTAKEELLYLIMNYVRVLRLVISELLLITSDHDLREEINDSVAMKNNRGKCYMLVTAVEAKSIHVYTWTLHSTRQEFPKHLLHQWLELIVIGNALVKPLNLPAANLQGQEKTWIRLLCLVQLVWSLVRVPLVQLVWADLNTAITPLQEVVSVQAQMNIGAAPVSPIHVTHPQPLLYKFELNVFDSQLYFG